MDRPSSHHALSSLLSPTSIAVVGGREAEAVVRQCERMGFSGPLWPVNPAREMIADRPCFETVGDLPSAPDAAFVAVPAEATIAVVRALAEAGAGGAICYASGFAETGPEGAALQERLIEAAAGMPVIGPNCYGTLNYLDGVALWPDQHGGRRVERGVAIVTQSGNMGINMTMQRRALPLAHMLSLGNQATVGIEDSLEALLEDPRVSAIGLHIEALRDIPAFERAALRALERRVPLVVLKTGRSETGARLTFSHTASLAGPDTLYDALFARLGVARVETLPAFLEALKLLAVVGPLPGNRLASVSCSGGEASLIADLAASRNLRFPELSREHRQAVKKTLGDRVAVSNPLDYHTFIWADEPAMTACFGAMLAGPFDLGLLITDYPRDDRCDDTDWACATRAFTAAAKASGRRAAVIATLPECLPEAVGEDLIARGIAPLQGMAEALAAIEAAVRIGTAQDAPRAPALLSSASNSSAAKVHDEWIAKRLLSEREIPVPQGQVVTSIEAAIAAQAAIDGPVALKALSSDLTHKTEAGAVVLGLHDPASIAAAAERLLALSDRVLVEHMIEDAVAELIVGLDRDPQFGLYLVLGTGGVLVELLAETKTLLLPTTADEVRQALLSLKTAPLLQGFRGRPAGDLDAAVDAVLRIAELAADERLGIEELDINPLVVRPEGRGVVAVDALLRTRSELPVVAPHAEPVEAVGARLGIHRLALRAVRTEPFETPASRAPQDEDIS
ncbi:MAG: acetate--CoA ligase family protein [Kiloniellales bacterium]|nr:acetate--CoA ligase family protein [Kiloniellales bacterium]